MQTPVFFSIVSANYLAYAQTLMRSVRGHHPGAPRYVFVIDADPDARGLDPDLFDVVPASDLPVPHFDHMALRYSILEFNTALKPFAFLWLAARHQSQPIIYLDPDILVLAPLVDVLEATASGALAVLTPHLTAPLTDDKHPNELAILRAGAYNLGFIAVGAHPSRGDLVRWWGKRLEFGAFVDVASGLFTDQKWIDLVPGLFPDVAILRHPGYNLAYWNLRQRGGRSERTVRSSQTARGCRSYTSRASIPTIPTCSRSTKIVTTQSRSATCEGCTTSTSAFFATTDGRASPRCRTSTAVFVTARSSPPTCGRCSDGASTSAQLKSVPIRSP